MSWAWRSVLGRPRSHVLSSLGPVRPHGSQLTTVLRTNNLIGSRGYASNSTGDSRSNVNQQDSTTKRHLYLVLDDHKDGYGVHKLDLGDNDDHNLDGGTRRLADPPFLRVALTTLRGRVQFAAVGSSIVAIGDTMISPALADRYIPAIGGVLMYDTKTVVLTVKAHLPEGLRSGYKAAMAVGNSLYMVGSKPPEPRFYWADDWEYGGGSLHCLTTDLVDPAGSEGAMFWGWQYLSRESSPWFWSHFESPPKLPFLARYVTAHAAHASAPGAAAAQHELFVSIRPTKTSMMGATFSFSTASMKWTRCGEWHMPVVGAAHYDDHLDAWVGPHAVNLDGNMYGPRVTDGHLCAGNVTSAPRKWKVGKEKLFDLDEDDSAGWRHVDTKIVPTSPDEGGTEYCLMERLRPKEELEMDKECEGKGKGKGEEECWGEGGKCLIRLTSFCVERGQDGEPLVTARRLARSYEVSWHNRHFDAQVFFI